MSKISTILDVMRARVAAVLPDHKKLKNPNRMDLNDTLFMAKGQVIQVSSGFNTNKVLSCKLSLSRQVMVTITRQIYGVLRDDVAREATEKALLEDQYLLIQDFETNPTLNTPSTATPKCSYVSDAGVQEIFIDEMQFLAISSIFEFEYFEQLA